MIDPGTLKIQLSNSYDLVCFEDLSTLTVKHSTIYTLFRSVRQDSFENNQRLIFYSSHRPSAKTLEHIQRAAARVDISNWFIKIYCPHDIQNDLVSVNQRHGYDDTSIEWQCCELTETAPISDSAIANYDTMCPAPWIHLDVWHTDDARPCCRYVGSCGSISKEKAPEIFYNEKFTTLRQQLFQGKQAQGCQSCWHSEQQGTQSYRKMFMDLHGDELNQGWLDDPRIREVSMNPNITCNFKCRICSDGSSSSIAVENIKFETDRYKKIQIKEKLKSRTIDIDPNNVIAYYRPLYADLKYFHIVGGEPLLMPGIDQLLGDMIDLGHADHIRLGINTNGSHYNPKMIELMSKFYGIEILLSIDDVGPRFEIQRGGIWAEVDSNIRKFAQLKHNNPKFKVQISTTVNIQNVFYLDQLIDYANDVNVDILWTYLDQPELLNIDRMTNAAKKIVYHKHHQSPHLELRAIANRVVNSKGSDGTEFLNETKKLDARRNQNFAICHSEIMAAMSIPN